MAATQGIRSSFPTQPILHSPKLLIYEYLFLFNQKLQEAVQSLKQLEKCPWLRRDFLRSFQIEVEDLRAQANFEVLEHMSDREQHDWAHFGKVGCSMEESNTHIDLGIPQGFRAGRNATAYLPRHGDSTVAARGYRTGIPPGD
jgi:hypothetical protein